ncbi:MAG: nucleotidyltransferase family protein [Sediminibacterium magnilacihabitans]|nr:nucleotidyltransferase family protein [Sediminibacterium magnilacihabitans]PQV60064.1 CBS domain protein [Sediminibacterium magnilacihabitans]
MADIEKYIVKENASIKDALAALNKLAGKLTLFVIDSNMSVVGTVTDGDIRRALIVDNDLLKPINAIMNRSFQYFKENERDAAKVKELRDKRIFLLPVVGANMRLLQIIDIEEYYPSLPVTVVIMAGGEGRRLRPLTEFTPKPMLQIADKPIIEHNIDRLAKFGATDIFISIKYLGHVISNYFGDGTEKSVKIGYLMEDEPLGTIGSLSKLAKQQIKSDVILVMNSDILTNIDFTDFYDDFANSDAAMSIACVSYDINIPYAVVETNNKFVSGLTEKPTMNYLTNGGIYLIKREILSYIPENAFFNATDLIDTLIARGEPVRSYKLLSYWLDIGKHEDFKKAQEDFKHIKF